MTGEHTSCSPSSHGAEGQQADLSPENSTDDCDWVAVGRLQGPFGVKGWVRVLSFTEPYERILTYSEWWLRENTLIPQRGEICRSRKIRLLSGRKHQRGVVASLQGMDTPEAARAFSGLSVWVPRSQLPEPEEGTHYWTDLVGLQVVTVDGQVLGVVEYVFATGANDVLAVREPSGEERLLPFNHEVVQNVDTSARTITVSLMPGM